MGKNGGKSTKLKKKKRKFENIWKILKRKNGQKFEKKVKKMAKMAKMVKNGGILKMFVLLFFFMPKEPPQTGTGHFHTIFGSKVTANLTF